MARGTARAAATAVLGLIALQAVGTTGGSGRIVQLLGDAQALVDRLLDPTVPAIPDIRNGDSWGTGGRRSVPTRASNRTTPQPRRDPVPGVPVPHF